MPSRAWTASVPLALEAGDFVLLPATPGFTMSGFEAVRPVRFDPKVTSAHMGEVRHGRAVATPTYGCSAAGSPSTRPTRRCWCHCCQPWCMCVVSSACRYWYGLSARNRANKVRPDLVLTRLVEVLLIEALRSTPGDDAPPGLLRGLADAHLASAMRQMHGQLARSWTVAQLAKTAALSRSAFFDRFTRTVGMPPMEYLLAWRMAVAKDLLRRHDLGLAEVAERVGYGSARPSAPRSAGTWVGLRVATPVSDHAQGFKHDATELTVYAGDDVFRIDSPKLPDAPPAWDGEPDQAHDL